MQKIGIATECITQENENNQLTTECNWRWQDLAPDATSFKDYDIAGDENKLKFYQIDSQIMVGDGTYGCKPECKTSCGMLNALTWVDPCTNQCIGPCDEGQVGQGAYCCLIDSDSQGWYSHPCDNLNDGPSGSVTDYLIKYDGSCHLASQACNKKSDIFVKYTQNLVASSEVKGGAEKNINWLTATKDEVIYPAENPMESASGLLRANVVEYVALWNPEHQAYYGAAYGVEPSGIIKVTGPFEFTQYTPYFVGAKGNAIITWAGKLPPRQTFELRHVTEYLGKQTFSENFIVLPFDTKIKMASDLCKQDVSGIPITQSQGINWWDPVKQEEIRGPGGELGGASCILMTAPNSPYDFPLEPGKVYKIIVDSDVNWKQI